MHCHFSIHMEDVKFLLRYTNGTVNYGIYILSQSIIHPYGFSDADWVGCLATRRSTSKYYMFIGSNSVFKSTKKQPMGWRFNVEAEYRFLAVTASKLNWLTTLLHDIAVFLKTLSVLFCDNLSMLHPTTNLVFHGRTACRDWLSFCTKKKKVANGKLIIQFISVSFQLADIFTQVLPKLLS